MIVRRMNTFLHKADNAQDHVGSPSKKRKGRTVVSLKYACSAIIMGFNFDLSTGR